MTEEFGPQSSQEPKSQARQEALAPHLLGTSPKGQREAESPKGAGLTFIWETVKIVVISLAIIVPVRYFLVQPFFVKGASMETTFEDGNYILIDEISYRFRDPTRGEVVVFRFPEDKTQFFIKRIIGLPEETVEIKNDDVIIYNKQHPDGFILEEKYLSAGQHTMGDMRMKLDPNEYFVLGDNRLRSSDSRRWGPLNRALITGRVFFRAWPVNEFGGVPTATY
ncbi:MAG: signal peptidase I [Candidatus Yanofskybacteria bacterium]|nr:signal peptidase I [Candidatus Yanofskybacteria bacterium]